MTIKEKFEAVKQIFSPIPPVVAPTQAAAPVAPVAPVIAPSSLDANVVSYAVDGGVPVFTDISDDGVPGLDVNDYLFTDEGLTVTYPDGSYNVNGTTFNFIVNAGVLTSVVDTSGLGCGMPIPVAAAAPSYVPPAPVTPATMQTMSHEAIKAQFALLGQGTIDDQFKVMQVMVGALMQSVFGYDIRQAAQADAIELYRSSTEVCAAQLKKQEQFSTQTIELLEQIVKGPTADPKTLPESRKETFESKKEERLKKTAESIRKMREERSIK